jgi:hypothetical protein
MFSPNSTVTKIDASIAAAAHARFFLCQKSARSPCDASASRRARRAFSSELTRTNFPDFILRAFGVALMKRIRPRMRVFLKKESSGATTVTTFFAQV